MSGWYRTGRSRGVGTRVEGPGARVGCMGTRVGGPGPRVQGRVQGSGPRVQRSGPRTRRPWWSALAIAGAFAGFASACAGAPEASLPSPVQGVEPQPGLLPAPDAAGRAWVERTLAGLSLEEAVGQLVFPWIAGSYAAADDPEFLETLEWVERWGIGGVAISIGTPHAYVAKLNALQRSSALPLLVTSDFENGGPAMRINHSYALPTLLPQGGGTSFPPTMAFGAIGDVLEVEEFARITAREARAVGVHVTFAPVLDVNSNPENPIINTRAFGEEPEEVARLGRAYIRGAREGGVLTTAKHFPGHGDTRVDSHLTLPEVTADRARLDAMEFVPFEAAVEEGVDAVMTAHVSVPQILGPGAPPATLSPEFMTEILREDLGFTGLLFTDALRMGAIMEGYGAGEAVVLALEAGADVILIPESVPVAVASVVEAVESGRVSRARVDASVRKILEAKVRLGLHLQRTVSPEGVADVVGIAEHRAAAERASARSMTLPRDREGLLPLDPDEVRTVLSVTYATPEDLPAGREFDAVLGILVPGVTSVRIGPGARGDELASILEQADASDVILFNAYVPPRAGAGTVALPDDVRDFVRTLVARRPTVLVSLGNPYLLNSLPEAGTYLVAWGDREISQRAAARAVAGARPIEGRLPITLPGLHARGEGLVREAIPEVVERGEARGDALDEAGILRAPAPAAPDAAADTIPSGAPGTPGGQLPGDVPPGGPPGVQGDPGPTVPMPPEGFLAPDSWRELSVSPLEVDPGSVGMDAVALDALDARILASLADSVASGAALAVIRRGRLVRLRGYGRLDWDPSSPTVTPASIYDLASLTKVVGTTSAVMLLVQEGRLGMDDPVVRHLPDFARGDPRKAEITVRDLLLHRGGFPPFRTYYLEMSGAEAFREAVYDLPLDAAPGNATVYSDIGFKTLAWVVETVTGEALDRFLERRLFAPLGMTDTGFNPPPAEWDRIAPTEKDTEWRAYHIRGEVHDENAHAMGGVAGHAGLFSTAQDLAVFVQLLANRGMLEPCSHTAGALRGAERAHPDAVLRGVDGGRLHAPRGSAGQPGARMGYAVGTLVRGGLLLLGLLRPHRVHGYLHLGGPGARTRGDPPHEPREPLPRELPAHRVPEGGPRRGRPGDHGPGGSPAESVGPPQLSARTTRSDGFGGAGERGGRVRSESGLEPFHEPFPRPGRFHDPGGAPVGQYLPPQPFRVHHPVPHPNAPVVLHLRRGPPAFPDPACDGGGVVHHGVEGLRGVRSSPVVHPTVPEEAVDDLAVPGVGSEPGVGGLRFARAVQPERSGPVTLDVAAQQVPVTLCVSQDQGGHRSDRLRLPRRVIADPEDPPVPNRVLDPRTQVILTGLRTPERDRRILRVVRGGCSKRRDGPLS